MTAFNWRWSTPASAPAHAAVSARTRWWPRTRDTDGITVKRDDSTATSVRLSGGATVKGSARTGGNDADLSAPPTDLADRGGTATATVDLSTGARHERRSPSGVGLHDGPRRTDSRGDLRSRRTSRYTDGDGDPLKELSITSRAGGGGRACSRWTARQSSPRRCCRRRSRPPTSPWTRAGWSFDPGVDGFSRRRQRQLRLQGGGLVRGRRRRARTRRRSRSPIPTRRQPSRLRRRRRWR